ncbi:MAG: hypothetical protein U0L27_07325 [Ruminococcus sp.]|nr:hypothetical protein [Ruminococcus sp.]
MIVSCMMVGLIATSAAYTDGKLPSNNTADIAKSKGDDPLGAKDSEDAELGANDDSEALGWTQNKCYVHYQLGNAEWANAAMDSSGIMTITKSSSTSEIMTFDLVAEDWWYKGKSGQQNISSVTTNSSANYYAWYEASSDSGNKGDRNYTVTLTEAGTYKFRYVTRTKRGDQDNAELQFNFWKENTSYTISYNSPSNGSFTTKPTTGTQGNTITVVATPNTGYQINNVSVYKTSASGTTVSYSRSGNTITFTMPAYAVTVNVTFSQVNYTITKNATNCTITAPATATYGSTVNVTVAPGTDYALKTFTVKQGSTNISTTSTGANAYSFTMPAGNVTITATCTTTVGLVSFKFKSATAYVYQPFISVNGGPEVKMTLDNPVDYLDQGPKPSTVKPNSDTGSLRYAWFTATLSGVDTSKPVTITVRGQDTYMEATGTFTLESNTDVWLACDNLMEGSELVNITSLPPAQRDFYDTPLNMIDN